MSDTTTDSITQQLLDDIAKSDDFSTDAVTAKIKNFEIFAKAKNLIDPEPEPEPEPMGFRAFVRKNSGDLIKVGGTLAAVSLIAVFEGKGDLIFRSKATKYI